MASNLFFSKWFYRGEGNKTLVISNPESRKVLRLQKSNVSQKTPECPRKQLERTQQSIKVCQQIFVPLLSEKYVEPGMVVELPEEFLASVKDLVTSANKERPKFRLGKEVNARSKFGVLMPDLCFVSGSVCHANENVRTKCTPIFCVEIKPKCGTLPVCTELENNAYKKVKESICKYCLFQWTKVNKQGKYLQRSGYCPSDLFSSDIGRVWHALMCLFKNPQNNLRIFKDGKVIYSEETISPPSTDHISDDNTTDTSPSPHLLQLEDILMASFVSKNAKPLTNNEEINSNNLTSSTMFLATILQLLVHDSNESNMVNHHSLPNHPVCAGSQFNDENLASISRDLLSKGLVFGQGGVLRKILNVQKMDEISSDKAFSIYDYLCASGLQSSIDSHIFNLTKSITTGNVCDSEVLNSKVIYENSPIGSKLDSITSFLMAASANDCSIMISFQQVNDETPMDSRYFQDVLTGVVYKYSIAVVDLDQKESARIPKYYKEYYEIIENYLQFNQI